MKGNLIIPCAMLQGIDENVIDSDPNNIIKWYQVHILIGYESNVFTVTKEIVNALKAGKYYHLELNANETPKALRNGGAIMETKFKITNAIECAPTEKLISFKSSTVKADKN